MTSGLTDQAVREENRGMRVLKKVAFGIAVTFSFWAAAFGLIWYLIIAIRVLT